MVHISQVIAEWARGMADIMDNAKREDVNEEIEMLLESLDMQPKAGQISREDLR